MSQAVARGTAALRKTAISADDLLQSFPTDEELASPGLKRLKVVLRGVGLEMSSEQGHSLSTSSSNIVVVHGGFG